MHLINAETYELEYFVGTGIPKYAILSHVWGKEEVLFQDMRDLDSARKKQGFIKIRYMCEQALCDGLKYAWVDTCCINKESSAELSEPINSMFKWYLRAETCYAHLHDIVVARPSDPEPSSTDPETRPPFRRSVWFTRGWTLQELIAPSNVLFMDRNWKIVGTKKGRLLETISHITNVDKEVLSNSSAMFAMTIAKRMSWASNRNTTRKEDEAYCLLGLFNVNIPLLYGEEENAFVRLQEELIRKTTDHSIFAHNDEHGNLLARSPRSFDGCDNVTLCMSPVAEKPYEMTNNGLRITVPILESNFYWDIHAVLNCQRNSRRLMLPLRRELGVGHDLLLRTANSPGITTTRTESLLGSRVAEILIARDPVSSLSSLGQLRRSFVPQLWLQFINRADGFALTCEKLDPPECWGVAARVPERIASRIQQKGTVAYFDLGSPIFPSTGYVTLTLTQHNLWILHNLLPISMTVRFKVEALSSGLLPSFEYSCSLDVWETFQFHEVPASSSHQASISRKLRLLDTNRMHVRLSSKGIEFTACLELITGYMGSMGPVNSVFLLELCVDHVKTNLTTSEAVNATKELL